jgi:predicted RNA polymerase sigma factor
LLPDPEVAGLLALMLLTDARRAARTGSLGEPIPLDKQNRTLWDQAQIAEGVALTSAALKQGHVGPYQLQAAIAAVHDEAPTFADTDWPQILALYELLLATSNNPVVALNHAVAVAMVHGPSKGLTVLDALNLDQHHRWHAAKAHLQEMAGDLPAALISYQTAAAQTASQPERVYLLTQAARLRER